MYQANRKEIIGDLILMELYAEPGLLSSALYDRVKRHFPKVLQEETYANLNELVTYRLARRNFSSPENDRLYLTKYGRRVAERLVSPDKEKMDRIFSKVLEKAPAAERPKGR